MERSPLSNLHLQPGTVTLVGFGPGAPDLLTIRGERALRQADIIFYDDLTNLDYLNSLAAEKVYVGKRSGRHHTEQDEINGLLLDAAEQRKRVVRLKGGDPMIFAHGGEEIRYLEQHNIPVDVIPGVTTATALAASTKVSLTLRGVSQSVAIVNGHSSNPIVPDTDTLVYYMGGARLSEIRQRLIAQGWREDTPVLAVHNVSLPSEQVFDTTIGQLGNETYPTPVIILVGDVAAYRHHENPHK
ncbi:MAG: uroporphyrinogen-III C-methyltransferase [Prevotella sp.]|nr:uroporphyrinogen-III C-methyltransferase [Prevotella sp.]